MAEIVFHALDTNTVRALQRGGLDAFGNKPETMISDGTAIPCRHCLQPVRKDEAYLVLSYRPFETLHPYAEAGPIFLHADECERAATTDTLAPMFHLGGSYILRGYRESDWINYEVADIVDADRIVDTAKAMLDREDVAYLHMRSSRFNCYQLRIERA